MRPETQRAETNAARPLEIDTCPSCRSELLPGMRFCRTCGYRLGEGMAEYVETVRLDGMPAMSANRPAAQTFGGGARPTTGLRPPPAAPLAPTAATSMRPRSVSCGGGAGWFVWVLVALLVMGVTGGGAALLNGMRRAAARRAGVSIPSITIPIMPRSFLGVSDFDYVRGEGVMLDAVLPGSPAHSAGLRDGDIIQRFDGRTINSEEDMRDTLRRTPVGKAVEVAFTRDGTQRTTMVKTVAPGDYDEKAYLPPNGVTGYWGVDDLERTRVAGEDYYGVRLGRVLTNSPADIAGLERGDIVVTFNGDPVRTTTGLGSYIDHAEPGSVVSVGVVRQGQRVEVPVKMGRDD